MRYSLLKSISETQKPCALIEPKIPRIQIAV